MNDVEMKGQGSTGNVVAALCNIFVPGLGQLVQGRFLAAAVFFVATAILWCCCLGWIPTIWSIYDAAVWQPRR